MFRSFAGVGRGWIIAGVVAVVVGGITIQRVYRPFNAEETAEAQHKAFVAQQLAETSRLYADLAMSPLATFTNSDSLYSTLQSTAPSHPSDLNETARAAVLRLSADLLFLRFVGTSPQEYRSWREAAGYTMKSAAEMRQREAIDHDYEFWFKEPYPGDEHIDSVYQRMWGQGMNVNNARSRPIGISTDRNSIAVAFGTMDLTSAVDRMMLENATGSTGLWREVTSGGFRYWFTDPNGGVRAELQRRKSLPVATVGVIFEFGKGDRYPFVMDYYQDSTGVWRLFRVNMLNSTPDRFDMLEF